MLPALFAQALRPELRRKIPNDMLVRLGMANLCGWVGYDICDDLLDDEGDPSQIPLANACLREAAGIYHSLMPECGLESRGTFDDIMERMEGANSWEREECRKAITSGTIDALPLPNYGNKDILAEKSLGHALGPLFILMRAGFPAASHEARGLREFFAHYLAARQMNDDAHDWEDDLRRGFINSASAATLSEWIRGAGKKTGSVRIEEELGKLRETFWNETLTMIAQEILSRIGRAREAIRTMSCLRDTEALESLLAPLEASAKKAERDQRRMREFLDAY